MSRRRKALVAVAFTYAQTIVGIATSLYVTRLLIRILGKDLYGVWLASGALLAYGSLADLGIFGILPWLIAEADGAKDQVKMRSVVAHGLILGVIGGALYLLVCGALWAIFPSVLHLTSADRSVLFLPLFLLAGITALTFPLRLFGSVQLGLQDYKFMGILALAQTLSGGLLTIVLARAGHGLYSLSLGAALPAIVGSIGGFWRTRSKNPQLVRDWPKPTWEGTRPLLTSGLGHWMGSVGWQMAFASDAIVIAYLGARGSIPMFVVTSRLGLTLMQFGWTVPDAALVGLAQLNAEVGQARARDAVLVLIRLSVIIAGGCACAILVVNGSFVRVWVGSDLFGGTQLNALFALDVIALSFAHSVVTPAAVLGKRVEVGVVTVVNGLLHIGLAFLLGARWGLRGVAAATAISALLTSIPIGLRFLFDTTTLRARQLAETIFLPWLVRLVPAAGLALVVGKIFASDQAIEGKYRALVVASACGGALGYAYLFLMKRELRNLPLGARLERLLGHVKLL